MFLAINELRKEKSRFFLITIVVALVSYLTFFLAALAYGLATSYTQGIDSWKASGIILQKDANNNVGRSLLTKPDYENFVGQDAATLGVGTATIEKDSPQDVSLFGIETDSFLAPKITDGKSIESHDQVIASDELKKIGVNLNDSIKFQGSDIEYTVVGFTSHATFQTAPIIYMQMDDWRIAVTDLAGMSSMKDDTTVSAIITRDDNRSRYENNNISWQTIRDFSFELPGYRAQVLTFSLMIGFLIIIASFVLAIFIYILTIQKASVFGVLKAEGVSNSYISRSVMIQILILLFTGLIAGLILALISGFALASRVPFMINQWLFGGTAGLFILFAALGGIASVRSVTKIDPVEAIG